MESFRWIWSWERVLIISLGIIWKRKRVLMKGDSKEIIITREFILID